MKKAKSNKKAKPTKSKEYHLLAYVLDSEPKLKRFDSKEQLGAFIDQFLIIYPDYASIDSGCWVDYAITNITGEVHFFTTEMKVD